MFKHPTGLYVLFFTEMWERFSYYGMRSLLILYMVGGLHFDVATASSWYGMYTAMIYLTPAVGGYLADRYLGQDRAILIGGSLMALGHFAMLLTPTPCFVGAMGLIVLGCGLFKPSVSVQVGTLYPANDRRRDGAFSLFYMGINLGGFLAPLVCGTLGQRWGWHWGFSSAGLGMLVAMAIYLYGRKHLPQGRCPSVRGLTALPELEVAPQTKSYRAIVALGVLALFGNIAFWATFEQAGTSLTLFAEQSVDLTVGTPGRAVPSSWFQMANPLFIMALTPLFTMVWAHLQRRQAEPSTPAKFVVGLVFVAAGFGVMVHAGGLADGGAAVSPNWLLLTYFFNTCAELCISPVGLSTVTLLAPAGYVSLAMGLWFASQALGNWLGGQLAGEYATVSHAAFFWTPTLMALGSAIVLLTLVPFIRRRMEPAQHTSAISDTASP